MAGHQHSRGSSATLDPLAALQSVEGFRDLGADELAGVASRFERVTIPAGETLIAQGEPPVGFFVILRGRVEVTQGTGSARSILNVLGPSATFGHMAFVDHLDAADATVRTIESTDVLRLSGDGFRLLLDDHPEIAAAFAQDAIAILKANFIAQTSTFSGLTAEQRRALADAIDVVRYAAGQVVIKQGEPGDSAYVVATGTASVIVEDRGATQVVAELSAGSLFGESALLTDAPRNATVRMESGGTLLTISRDTLMRVLDQSDAVTADLVGLLRMRWRPKQKPRVTIHHRPAADGDDIVILKNEANGTYYRMAADGLYIWNRLDGETTLREIAMGYLTEFGRFDPNRVATAVKGLVDAGFASAPGLSSQVDQLGQPKGLAVLSLKALAVLQWTKAVEGIDDKMTTLDRWVGRWLFSLPGVGVLALISVAGVVATIRSLPRSADFLSAAGAVPLVLLAFIPANAVGAVLHEGAHALSVKRFGRQVKRAGVGWYLITPVAFVDTSDMWLTGRGPRVLVSLAGPFMNLALGGAAALLAASSSSPLATALLWEAALASYYLAILNLNPLLEFDGYYVLSDLLDRPNLREDALEWLGSGFPKALRNPKLFRGHGGDLIYGALAAGYLLLMAFFILVAYRTLVQRFIARVVPDILATSLAWVLAAGVATLLVLALSAQIRGLKAPKH